MPPSIDTILQQFRDQLSLHVRPTWLSTMLTELNSGRNPPPPATLFATLKGRVLGSDFTTSLQPHANICLPVSVLDEAKYEIAGPVAVQVLMVEDMGVSRLDQIERLEMIERGEVNRGREIIRIAPEDEENREGQPLGQQREHKSGPCKLLVEDASGRRVYAIELKAIDNIKVGMFIGTKLVLKTVPVARGVLLLTPKNTIILGGKIDALHQHHLSNRKQTLQASIDQLRSATL